MSSATSFTAKPANLAAVTASMLRSVTCLLALGSAASAEPAADAKACILRSAEFLPRIPGIEIRESRTVDVPSEMKTKLDPKHFHAIVEIDAKAVGQDTTYKFICVVAPGVVPLVQRVL
jgi:hypothetical protein